MTGRCCTGEGLWRRIARRLSGGAACMLPGAALVLLPKCPLCLAAWLAVVTGASVPAGWAAGVRGVIVVFWIAAVAQLIWRRPRLYSRPGR
jgi:hypothetical protein